MSSFREQRSRSCRGRCRAGFALLVLPVLLALCTGFWSVVEASEKILSFESRITVHADSTMEVTEIIRVVSAGDQIERGIYRDFPTQYKDVAGNRYSVKFEVVSIMRDGAREPYHTESLSNGIRVYMGRKDYFLPPGEHTYTLTYRTDRQLGFFEDHDELYWNVTGNGWSFPMDRVEARVLLPEGVPVGAIRLEGYTGPMGAKGEDFSSSVSRDGAVWFKTTRGLDAGEGLTVVVTWPKGFVREPSSREKTQRLFQDNLSLFASLVGVLVVLLYYMMVWHRVGKDPEKGVIVPLYTPPDGLSPAGMRFIMEQGYDDRVFASAVIDAAVKGCLTITENRDTYTLHRIRGDDSRLSPEEQKTVNLLFGSSDSIVLSKGNHIRIAAAGSVLRSSLAISFEKTYFVTNKGKFILGVLISAVVTAVSFFAANNKAEALFMGVWLSIWSIGVAFIAAAAVAAWRQVFTSSRGWGGKIAGFGGAVFMTLFALPFIGGEIFGLYTLGADSPALVGLLVLVVFLNALFYHLLKAPTLLGRKVLDRIEGFKMFLGATETDRLNRMYPAERTPELFEKFLPYALALGVEQAWTEQFADVLAAAALPESGGYHPMWYSGSRWSAGNMASFGSSLGSSLGSAISSSSTAPGSSSGSGGGGSSGGGGGGGGGGGW